MAASADADQGDEEKQQGRGKLCLCRVKNELAHLISRQPSDMVDSLARSLFICSIYVFF